MTNKEYRNRLLAVGLAIATVMGLSSARANLMSFTIDTANPGVSPYPGPYGSVDVDLTSSTTATITFTGDSVGGYQYAFGANGCVAVNVNATSWSLGGFSGTPFNSDSAVPANLSDGGMSNEDGFGRFNQTIDNFDGFTHSWQSVSFVLTDLSGTWSDASDVLAPTMGGYSVGAHVFVIDPSGANPSTGYAVNAGSSGNNVPDGGGTLALLGLAGIGLFMVRRKFQFV
jgi:hypothetical protein